MKKKSGEYTSHLISLNSFSPPSPPKENEIKITSMSIKTCSKCKLAKALDDFPKCGKTARGTVKTRGECKSCRAAARKQPSPFPNELGGDKKFSCLKNTESLTDSRDAREYRTQTMRELQTLESEINDRPVSEFRINQCKFSAKEVQDKLRNYVIHQIPGAITNLHKITVEECFDQQCGPYYLAIVPDVNFKILHRDEFMNIIIDRDVVSGHSINVSMVGLEHDHIVENIMIQWFTAKRIQIDMKKIVVTRENGLTISWPKNQSIALSQIAILTDFVNDQLIDILMSEN